jgi:hypothetical protein
MSFITFCHECETDTTHYQGGCLRCKEKEIKKSKETFIETRSKMTIEERLILLESEWFDHKQNHPSKPIMFA